MKEKGKGYLIKIKETDKGKMKEMMNLRKRNQMIRMKRKRKTEKTQIA